MQLIGVAAILAWTVSTSFLVFTFAKVTVGLRVSEETEKEGLDQGEHGGKAFYNPEWTSFREKAVGCHTDHCAGH